MRTKERIPVSPPESHYVHNCFACKVIYFIFLPQNFWEFFKARGNRDGANGASGPNEWAGHWAYTAQGQEPQQTHPH